MAPNPMKIALFLEEAGLEYEPIAIDSRRGHQHSPAYKAINPNAKVPALVDGDAVVFDSNAILLYLAEKTGKFLPDDNDVARAQLLSWLMFIASGVGPFSGQAVHFRNFAIGSNPYSENRYDYEAKRHWQIIDDQLAKQKYMLGDKYTIVDMSVWGWASRIPLMLGVENLDAYPHLNRLMEEIDARPAAKRTVTLDQGHAFKPELDEEALRYMYPQNYDGDKALFVDEPEEN